MTPPPFTFDSPAALWAGLGVAAAAVVVVIVRRPALPPLTLGLGLLALLLLAAAAGGPVWRRPRVGDVVVMVDLSPSTRVARFRDLTLLRERVRQLLGGADHRTVYFADGDAAVAPDDLAGGERLSDAAVDRTAWPPPAADAVLLFSDARFDLPPWAPPTHVVVDPALEAPEDAAVERMEARGGELAVTARNTAGPRAMAIAAAGEVDAEEVTVPAGGAVITKPLDSTAEEVVARLSRGDRWPENDALSLVPPPPAMAERWWVGGRDGGEGWRTFYPGELPYEAVAYLAPSVIVLDNVAAAALTDGRRQRLRQYVTELGGGLVILGGDEAFAAGGYAGTALDALSPLASHPPRPAAHWVFLIDSSGSMNAPAAGGRSRWAAAVDAVARAAATLPPQDLVSAAGFAAGVEWWVRGRPAAEAASQPLPPAGARPSGPTELRRALEAVVPAGGDTPVELLVLTDANAPLEDPAPLVEAMREAKTRLHLLDIGDAAGAGLPALRQIATETGGTLLREAEPADWAAAVRRLTRSAAPDLLVQEPARVEFTGPLAGLPPRTVMPPWNRTWLKPRATAVATGMPPAAGPSAPDPPPPPGPLAATWQAGEGKVSAVGFSAPGEEAEPFARLVARPPRDPRLRIEWDAAAKLVLSVDALDPESGYMNGLALSLEIRDAAGDGSAARDAVAGAAARTIVDVPQVGPGRYEVSVDAPNAPAIALLRRDGDVVDRAAVPGRYAREFDEVGNDRRAMRELAGRTGGSVVEPSATGPLLLPRAVTPVPLTSPAATAAAVCLAAALVRWRVA